MEVITWVIAPGVEIWEVRALKRASSCRIPDGDCIPLQFNMELIGRQMRTPVTTKRLENSVHCGHLTFVNCLGVHTYVMLCEPVN